LIVLNLLAALHLLFMMDIMMLLTIAVSSLLIFSFFSYNPCANGRLNKV